MADIVENDIEAKLRRDFSMIQVMIDISIDRLEGLRTQCNANAELTQQEIRTLENKLVKMFSELLITKAKLPEKVPKVPPNAIELKQWLRVVGLSPESLNIVIQKAGFLEALLEKSELELGAMLSYNSSKVREEEVRRLIQAIRCLNKCQLAIRAGKKEQPELFWDSWDRQQYKTGLSPRVVHRTANRNHRHHATSENHQSPAATSYHSSIMHSGSEPVQSPTELSPPEDLIPPPPPATNATVSPEESSFHTLTPSPSPPNSPSVSLSNKAKTKGFITTPPPRKKHQTLVSAAATSTNNILGTPPPHNNSHYHVTATLSAFPSSNNNSAALASSNGGSGFDQNSLTKSKSHEFHFLKQQQLQKQQENMHQQLISSHSHQPSTNSNGTGALPTPRSRLHTEPDPEHADDSLGDNSISNNLTVPRSPCTPIIGRGMAHTIQHRFTKKFKMTSSTCDLCNKQMFFGFKCTECKYRCHKDCKSNVPPSCGLPPALMEEFKKTINDTITTNTSPNLGRSLVPSGGRRDKPRNMQTHIQPYHGPDSSSAGSSCNSSSPSSPALLASLPPVTPASTSNRSQFNFPEVPVPHTANGVPEIEIKEEQVETRLQDTHRSNDSDKTVSLTGSTSTSTDSDRTPIRLDSMEERDSGHWPRQNSLSLKEWDIPFDDLKLLDIIGTGRFGTVHRGLWHGDVAVKVLRENYLDDERTLEAFKLEVATFKKTRHENLVLFMGACMQPPQLALITSLCKGNTLFTLVHLRKDKFNLNRTTLVAQQISQGMGYLHARGIVHKDLKTKNIFLENGKVIITDFGLFSATKLQYTDRGIGVARDWLCYLAPELIRGLRPYRPTDEDLPFTKGSDVYAFGTVWYELLCGEFPFKEQPHESVIWQVGRGMKQTLANLQAARDVKDILMLCWAFEPESRPDFSKLLTNLERLPKKRLARSPSHPIQLSRSAESVF